MKIKGKRILKNGAVAGYVYYSHDRKWKWRIIGHVSKKKMRGGVYIPPEFRKLIDNFNLKTYQNFNILLKKYIENVKKEIRGIRKNRNSLRQIESFIMLHHETIMQLIEEYNEKFNNYNFETEYENKLKTTKSLFGKGRLKALYKNTLTQMDEVDKLLQKEWFDYLGNNNSIQEWLGINNNNTRPLPVRFETKLTTINENN